MTSSTTSYTANTRRACIYTAIYSTQIIGIEAEPVLTGGAAVMSAGATGHRDVAHLCVGSLLSSILGSMS